MKLRHSHIAWAVIIAYELGARDGELLSEMFDPWDKRVRVLLICYTAAHCANLLSPRIDLYYWLARWARRTLR